MGDCISADIDILVMVHAKTIKDERVTTQILVAVGQRAGGYGFILCGPAQRKKRRLCRANPFVGRGGCDRLELCLVVAVR